MLPLDLERVVVTLLSDIGTPKAFYARECIRAGRWDCLVSLRADPSHYDDPEAYFKDALVSDLLRKCKGLDTGVDLDAAAIDTFYQCERECHRTNLRIAKHFCETTADRIFYDQADDFSAVACYDLIVATRKNVERILGSVPPELQEGLFGPGATYADKGAYTTIPHKMASSPTLTPQTYPFLFEWAGTAWASAVAERGDKPMAVRGNRFTTVDKDSTKKRGIAIEPSINLFYQLAYGRAIRKRLRRSGVDLIDGQDIHRQVVREASISGHFATIDLSNASDTIARDLVRLLLPPMWFDLLNTLRSPTTQVEGKIVRLEKFSSMGNGFTFELETVIFVSIAQAVYQLRKKLNPDLVEARIGDGLYTYGDDIIVPSCIAHDVIGALKYFGFSPNERKTFIDGMFKESCGGDYFEGVDVRPHYIKEFPNEPQHWIALANGIWRMGLSDPRLSRCRSYLRRAWFRCLDNIPEKIRECRGPESLGDLVIHDDEKFHTTRWRYGRPHYRVYRPARFRFIGFGRFDGPVVLACAVYGAGTSDRGVAPRDNVLGYKLGWVSTGSRLIPSWQDGAVIWRPLTAP